MVKEKTFFVLYLPKTKVTSLKIQFLPVYSPFSSGSFIINQTPFHATDRGKRKVARGEVGGSGGKGGEAITSRSFLG